jgi:hypothetical protein
VQAARSDEVSEKSGQRIFTTDFTDQDAGISELDLCKTLWITQWKTCEIRIMNKNKERKK